MTKGSAELLTKLRSPGGFCLKSCPFHILKRTIFAWLESLCLSSWRKFEVVLPYNESGRCGIETEQSKVPLSVRGHLRKTGLFTSAMFSPNEKKKNEFIGVELIHLKLQGRMRNFIVKKRKRVNSQVLSRSTWRTVFWYLLVFRKVRVGFRLSYATL